MIYPIQYNEEEQRKQCRADGCNKIAFYMIKAAIRGVVWNIFTCKEHLQKYQDYIVYPDVNNEDVAREVEKEEEEKEKLEGDKIAEERMWEEQKNEEVQEWI